MARIVPELDPATIEDAAEARLYGARRDLPEDYTVVYKYKFCDEITGAMVWQADLAIIHPFRGFMVFKVLPGQVALFNGRWHEYTQGGYREMDKDPLAEARAAAYAIVRLYREKYGWNFPLALTLASVFPAVVSFRGRFPPLSNPPTWCWSGIWMLCLCAWVRYFPPCPGLEGTLRLQPGLLNC